MAQGTMTVDDDEIIRRMARDNDPAYTTAEIADWFDMSTEGIRGRLETLYQQNRIHKKKPSSRTVIWWTNGAHNADSFSA